MASLREISPEPRESFGTNGTKAMAWATVSLAVWLIIGGIAYSDQDEGTAIFICILSLPVQAFAVSYTVIFIGLRWPGRGLQVFAAGMVGLGVAGFYTIALSNLSGVRPFFWTQSGMYMGWLLETLLRPFAVLAGYLDGAPPPVQSSLPMYVRARQDA